jgi:urease accessory protein
MDASSSAETHLLYILLDSNLPTGGFVASSGLESYTKHGFLGTASNAGSIEGLVKFVQESVRNYAASTGGVVRDSWKLVGNPQENGAVDPFDDVLRLDALYDAMTLNHVTRRSSTAQGIALLTLFSKAFADARPNDDPEGEAKRIRGKLVIDRFKKLVRLGKTPGHLPICWGLLTSSAGLSLGKSNRPSMACEGLTLHSAERTTHLHLFLHIRAILSSAVRLNIIGPYAATHVLYTRLSGCLDDQVQHCAMARTGCLLGDLVHDDDDVWAWARRAEEEVSRPEGQAEGWGPAMTWPLGETLMNRHDFQHTRIFNS